MKPSALRIVVAGHVASTLERGGAAWTVLQYAVGLWRLGHEVLLVEPLTRDPAPEEEAYFRCVADRFGFSGSAAMVTQRTRTSAGMGYGELLERFRSADLLLNLSGALEDPELLEAAALRAYVDLGPGAPPGWEGNGASNGTGARLRAHDRLVTTAFLPARSNGKAAHRARPHAGWISTLQPVVLDEWPSDGQITYHALTTIADGDVPLPAGDPHELEEYLSLPSRSRARFLLAVPDGSIDAPPLDALRRHGWGLVDPRRVAGTPDGYRSFVQGSLAGFDAAAPGAVRCGRLGCRSAYYLASGRPVVARHTGFRERLPGREGLLAFETGEEAVSAVDAIHADYQRHARAAREIAEAHFDAGRVLPALLDRLGAGSATRSDSCAAD